MTDSSDTTDLQPYREGRRCFLTDLLLDNFEISRFIVVDVGSDIFNYFPDWISILRNHITIHSFEVMEDQRLRHAEAAREKGIDARYHPYAIGSGRGIKTFHVTWSEGGSSFYLPDQAVAGPLAYTPPPKDRSEWRFGRHLTPVETFEFPTISLDEWCADQGIVEIDFLKANAQGSEYDILFGGQSAMAHAVGAQVELQYAPLYQGAPLFGECHMLLDRMGFTFFDCLAPNYCGYIDAGVYFRENTAPFSRPRKRIFEGHFLFFRELIASRQQFDSFTVEKILKLACIAELFGHIEYGFALARCLAERSSDAKLAGKVRALVKLANERMQKMTTAG